MKTSELVLNDIKEGLSMLNEENEIDYDFQSKEDAGVLTNDDGILYVDENGRKFWITVQQL